MSYRIAVEGLEKDIVPTVCKGLEHGGYDVVYRHESPALSSLSYYSEVIDSIIESKPDVTVLCNAGGYISFLRKYEEKTSIPLIVLTGGGPEFEEHARRYTPHVLSAFFYIERLYDKIEKILEQQDSDS